MINIFSHRAQFHGVENSKKGIINCINSGFGLELDLRCDYRGVYLSHDLSKTGELFSDVCPFFKNSRSLIALHIKELECVEKTVELLHQHDVKNCFLFDSDYEYILKKSSKFDVAFYANSEPQKNSAKIFWCDEVKEKWYSKNIIKKLHGEGKILYAVSIELVMPARMPEIIDDWKRLMKLGFDGICTNFPEKLNEIIKNQNF